MGQLTALKVKSLKAAGRHPDGNGLYLFIRESGSKSWVLRVQHGGKRYDRGLGSLDDLTLAQAREKADEWRKAIKRGVDPLALHDAPAAKTIPTFSEAAEAAHEEFKRGWRNEKAANQWLSSLREYAFPHIGDTPVDEVNGPAVRELLAEIWMKIPETARRVRQRIGAVIGWSVSKGYRETEISMNAITTGLSRQPPKDRHFAALPYADAPKFVATITAEESVGRLALRFLILTAARSGEVRKATWAEIDLAEKTWTIPGSRMKAGKLHIVALSAQALEILRIAGEAYGTAPDATIFPGQRNKPMSDMTLTKVIRDNWDTKITAHGFRSTFTDWAAEQTEISSDVVQAALAHKIKNRVEAAYRRTNYLEKRRELMRLWGDYVAPMPALGAIDA